MAFCLEVVQHFLVLRHAVDHMNGFPFSTLVTIAYQSCFIVWVFGVQFEGLRGGKSRLWICI